MTPSIRWETDHRQLVASVGDRTARVTPDPRCTFLDLVTARAGWAVCLFTTPGAAMAGGTRWLRTGKRPPTCPDDMLDPPDDTLDPAGDPENLTAAAPPRPIPAMADWEARRRAAAGA